MILETTKNKLVSRYQCDCCHEDGEGPTPPVGFDAKTLTFCDHCWNSWDRFKIWLRALAEVRLPKGTLITCPRCDRLVATVMRDLTNETPIKDGDILGLNIADPTCKKCKVHVVYKQKIHTEHGWL